MAVTPSLTFGTFLKRYATVILFPLLTASTIYADYSHTQKWKAQKALKQA